MIGVQSVHEVQLFAVVFVRLHGSVRYRAVAERRAVWIVVVGLAHISAVVYHLAYVPEVVFVVI